MKMRQIWTVLILAGTLMLTPGVLSGCKAGDAESPDGPADGSSIPLAEFLGADQEIFDSGTLTAGIQDCEAGYLDLGLDQEEAREKLKWLSALVVTGKENDMSVTGDTEVYRIYSPEGELLERLEFYHGLLVMEDGMYGVETLEQ